MSLSNPFAKLVPAFQEEGGKGCFGEKDNDTDLRVEYFGEKDNDTDLRVEYSGEKDNDTDLRVEYSGEKDN